MRFCWNFEFFGQHVNVSIIQRDDFVVRNFFRFDVAYRHFHSLDSPNILYTTLSLWNNFWFVKYYPRIWCKFCADYYQWWFTNRYRNYFYATYMHEWMIRLWLRMNNAIQYMNLTHCAWWSATTFTQLHRSGQCNTTHTSLSNFFQIKHDQSRTYFQLEFLCVVTTK